MPKNATDYVVEDDFDINARPQTSADSPVNSDWKMSAESAGSGNYPIDFKWNDKTHLVRFVPGPVHSYKEHWLTGKTSGKKGYVCLNPKNKPELSCPLCTMADGVDGRIARSKAAFTIANYSVDPFERQLLIAPSGMIKVLGALDDNKVIGPLVGKYWAMSKSGTMASTAYHITPVKERDLEEDWDIDPTAAKTFLESIEPFSDSVVKRNTYAELLEIAQSL